MPAITVVELRSMLSGINDDAIVVVADKDDSMTPCLETSFEKPESGMLPDSSGYAEAEGAFVLWSTSTD